GKESWKEFPLVKEDWVREHPGKLDIHKSMGPEDVSTTMRELLDTIARPLTIIFEMSWQSGEVPEDWKKANVTPVFQAKNKEDLGNYWQISLILVPSKVMEQILLETMLRHIKDRKVI
ncbi:hypothetical protein N305_02296, partial [Manacus vitellinus]